MFELGKVYHRRDDLHRVYNGQRQGGISTPSKHPIIFLFTGESGEEYGYADGWQDDGTFLYSGEGQVGDMEFVRGNKAIRDHAKNGKQLHLFRDLGDGSVRYEGQFECRSWEYLNAPDRRGHLRRAIMFRLAPVK